MHSAKLPACSPTIPPCKRRTLRLKSFSEGSAWPALKILAVRPLCLRRCQSVATALSCLIQTAVPHWRRSTRRAIWLFCKARGRNGSRSILPMRRCSLFPRCGRFAVCAPMWSRAILSPSWACIRWTTVRPWWRALGLQPKREPTQQPARRQRSWRAKKPCFAPPARPATTAAQTLWGATAF